LEFSPFPQWDSTVRTIKSKETENDRLDPYPLLFNELIVFCLFVRVSAYRLIGPVQVTASCRPLRNRKKRRNLTISATPKVRRCHSPHVPVVSFVVVAPLTLFLPFRRFLIFEDGLSVRESNRTDAALAPCSRSLLPTFFSVGPLPSLMAPLSRLFSAPFNTAAAVTLTQFAEAAVVWLLPTVDRIRPFELVPKVHSFGSLAFILAVSFRPAETTEKTLPSSSTCGAAFERGVHYYKRACTSHEAVNITFDISIGTAAR
jgi:hypothetical protein